MSSLLMVLLTVSEITQKHDLNKCVFVTALALQILFGLAIIIKEIDNADCQVILIIGVIIVLNQGEENA